MADTSMGEGAAGPTKRRREPTKFYSDTSQMARVPKRGRKALSNVTNDAAPSMTTAPEAVACPAPPAVQTTVVVETLPKPTTVVAPPPLPVAPPSVFEPIPAQVPAPETTVAETTAAVTIEEPVNEPAVAEPAADAAADTATAEASTSNNNNNEGADVPMEEAEATHVWMYGDNLPASLPVGVRDLHAARASNPVRFCLDYTDQIHSHLKRLEVTRTVASGFMTRQTEVSPDMRAVMVDWLVDVAQHYHLSTCCLHTTVQLVDRFLAVSNITRTRLQLLGCACMLIATKLEEPSLASVDDFVFISDNTYTREEVIAMESTVLHTLGFHIISATSWHFLDRLVCAADSPVPEMFLTRYLAEVALQEYDLAGFAPSMIAAASLYMARRVMNLSPAWDRNLEFWSGYTARRMLPCVTALHTAHMNIASNRLQAIRDKYSAAPYHRVSLLNPLPASADLTL